jgi:hypothetical protein
VQPEPVNVATDVAPPEQPAVKSRPEGFGVGKRLDDPQLSSQLAQARNERAQLADEYRRVTSPMVETGAEIPTPVHPAVAQQPQATPAGSLFSPAHTAAPDQAHGYPQPARPPAVDVMHPHPGIAPSIADPAADPFAGAFQRPPVFAPQSSATG